MNTRCVSALLGSAILLASVAGAAAADLGGYGGSVKDYSPEPTGPAWYFRIDGGYAVHEEPEMYETLDAGYGAGKHKLYDTDLDDTWTLGGGIGKYFGSRFRGDITYDHRFEADAKGSLDAGCCGEGRHTFGVESDVVLLNLYYDFNRGGRISPYVGAGVGVAFNQTTKGSYSDDCGCVGVIEEDDETEFAVAAMAGFTTRLRGGTQVIEGGSVKDGPVVVEGGRALYLDVGYRFLYLGDAVTGPVVINNQQVSEDPVVEDINAHEFRIGLRMDLQ